MNIRSPKKLIEVALPLDDINVASAREKSIRHGHPSTLHLWWARRPLAAARAVIFAQMVNDPGGERGYYAGKTRAQADAEREELFQILRELVLWENTNNEAVLARARAAIAASWRETCALNKGRPGFDPEQLPAFHDPFAGGGALPLEAQRLGLESFASDLNPVAVTINKAMIEIPPKFAGRAPVGPAIEAERGTKKGTREAFPDWSGARGLAEDVRRYGAWMREQALQRIGHLYPSIEITPELIANNDHSTLGTGQKSSENLKNAGLAGLQPGQQLTVIAWLWARTVKSPNPAFSQVDVPLASSFILSSKAGKESWVHPVVEGDGYHFEVRTGTPPAGAKEGTKLARGANFRCLMSGVPIEPAYIKAEGAAGRMGARLMAIVAEGARGRVYLAPTAEHEAIAQQAQPSWKPETALPDDPRNFWTLAYGLTTWGDLFTPRQLVALTTFSDLVPEAIARVRADALAAGMPDDGRGLDAGGTGATAYAEAVGVYLGLAVDKTTDYNSSLVPGVQREIKPRRHLDDKRCRWFGTTLKSTLWLGRLAIWTFRWVAYVGPCCPWLTPARCCATCGCPNPDRQRQQSHLHRPAVLRQHRLRRPVGLFLRLAAPQLRPIFPNLYATLAVPKAEELVATPYRHGGKEAAEAFFPGRHDRRAAQPGAPGAPGVSGHHLLRLQAERHEGRRRHPQHRLGDLSGGRAARRLCADRHLAHAHRAGCALDWHRHQRAGLQHRAGVPPARCGADTISRREFQRLLREHLPEALQTMIGGSTGQSPIAPVDLAQAAIGPGMALYSQYPGVLNQDGTPMTRARRADPDQPRDHRLPHPRRRRLRRRHAVLQRLVRAIRLGRGPLRRGRRAGPRQGHQRGRRGRGRHRRSGAGKVRLLRWADYAAAGTRRPTPAPRCGKPPTT
jgi:putative DNA methylase